MAGRPAGHGERRPPQRVRASLSKLRTRPLDMTGPMLVRSMLGAVVLDLRELVAGSRAEVVADSLLGKVEIFVPAGTRVMDGGTATLGKRSVVDGRRRAVTTAADGPVLLLRGHSTLGHVRVTVAD